MSTVHYQLSITLQAFRAACSITESAPEKSVTLWTCLRLRTANFELRCIPKLKMKSERLREQAPETTISNAKGRLSRVPAPLSVIQWRYSPNSAVSRGTLWHLLAPSGTFSSQKASHASRPNLSKPCFNQHYHFDHCPRSMAPMAPRCRASARHQRVERCFRRTVDYRLGRSIWTAFVSKYLIFRLCRLWLLTAGQICGGSCEPPLPSAAPRAALPDSD